MTEMNKIKMEALENVTGGKKDVVNNTTPGYAYANCRKEPGLKSEILFTLENGTNVYPTGKFVTKDGYDWYEIRAPRMTQCAWIAGHLIGR